MEEIRIPKNQLLLVMGLLMGPVAIILGVYFYSLAGGPSIRSPLIVQMVGVFISLSGLLALALVIHQFIYPSTLVINENGISSHISFGFVPWSEIVSIELYERVEGVGKQRVNVKGVLIKAKDPEKILGEIRGLKKFGPNRSFRLRGSPIFIPDVNWSWRLDKIHEKLQAYWAQYSRKSGA
ncbi:hypothetical protein MNBD_ALPHA11-1619 [hydrothermal vent metagenome]|uniref:PH domain-containing protein n=1 Tax=hydrothermal vent metagenome TaxID=652676 RepID=A0A3B0U297_9ZZZZ